MNENDSVCSRVANPGNWVRRSETPDHRESVRGGSSRLSALCSPLSAIFRCDAVALVVVAIGAALRVYGLRWGLPHSLHWYSYHPDEFLTVGAAFFSIYLGRSLNPRFYNYPSLFLYLCALAIGVAFGYGAVANLTNVYLAARVVTVIMGTAAVAATYWAGKTLANAQVGLVAASILCVAPIHVQHSHFATVDVPSTLFVALALGYAGLVVRRGSVRDYALGGAMAGLAAENQVQRRIGNPVDHRGAFPGKPPSFGVSRSALFAVGYCVLCRCIRGVDSRRYSPDRGVPSRGRIRDRARRGRARACVRGDGKWVSLHIPARSCAWVRKLGGVVVGADRGGGRSRETRALRAGDPRVRGAILRSDLCLAGAIRPLRPAAVSGAGNSVRLAGVPDMESPASGLAQRCSRGRRMRGVGSGPAEGQYHFGQSIRRAGPARPGGAVDIRPCAEGRIHRDDRCAVVLFAADFEDAGSRVRSR